MRGAEHITAREVDKDLDEKQVRTPLVLSCPVCLHPPFTLLRVNHSKHILQMRGDAHEFPVKYTSLAITFCHNSTSSHKAEEGIIGLGH